MRPGRPGRPGHVGLDSPHMARPHMWPGRTCGPDSVDMWPGRSEHVADGRNLGCPGCPGWVLRGKCRVGGFGWLMFDEVSGASMDLYGFERVGGCRWLMHDEML